MGLCTNTKQDENNLPYTDLLDRLLDGGITLDVSVRNQDTGLDLTTARDHLIIVEVSTDQPDR